MNNDEHKSGLHIHLGGLVLIIIVILILFKVDIKEKIQSEQFQENISYVESQIKNIWEEYLKKPLMTSWNGLFNNLINKGVDRIKEGPLYNLQGANQFKTEEDANFYQELVK